MIIQALYQCERCGVRYWMTPPDAEKLAPADALFMQVHIHECDTNADGHARFGVGKLCGFDCPKED